MKNYLRLVCLALAPAVSAAILPAAAHHSAAAFDRTKPFILKGTMVQWLWANPHIWAKVMVPDGKGGSILFKLEGGSATGMARYGGSAHSFKPGDAVKFLVAPYRDGSNGGEFLAVWNGAGQQLKF